MKRFAILASVVFLISNCAIDNISPNSASSTILGKWKVVKDSLNFGGDEQSYLKSDSDFYNFLPNGVLIVKEGRIIDIATYSLSTDNNYITILFKKSGPGYVVVRDGVLIKDSLANKFRAKFLIEELSTNSFNFSTALQWTISPPNPPVIAISPELPTYPIVVDVNIVTQLKK